MTKDFCWVLVIFTLLCGCAAGLNGVAPDTTDDIGTNVHQSDEGNRGNDEQPIDKETVNTNSQRQKMEDLKYIIKEVEGDSETPERELISFDDGVTWEYYEHRIKCYFPEENVYRWERYCPENGEKQISIDDGRTWYYIRVNDENNNTEISQDKNEWIEIPSVETWSPIQPDDNQYTSANVVEK